MPLTDDLISQFVKITNDKKDVKEENTVYGTIKKKDGKTFVQLDGANDETLTPVTEAASTNDGERVTVMIKNHTAIVTGNLSSPSARSGDVDDLNDTIHEFDTVLADKISTEELEVERARINDLEADNAVIKGLLEANDIDVGQLQADYVTVNKSLAAVQANVENLAATKLDADIAKVTYATVEDLEAINADVHDLEATYGDINTLIFGSATGTTIHTSFANAVIAQLGDAQIKSAMIDEISASKIAAGDIITNNVRVKSQNGLLLISDETIQISDNTRVRVQIGKDSSNDYSINVWDADGNLMFSKGGITDSAIKDAIIRNDMVSDTANIAAHKLDIDSLFEEINGGTNTIKSSRIYLDDEKQTLDVAFKELDTTVTDLGSTVSSQGTQITTIQGQISTKIWQQDIDTASNEISTQYSTLEQEVDNISATVASHTSEISKKADSTAVTSVIDRVTILETDVSGFKTTVSETYATNTDVSAIEIGGRNLYTGSSDFSGTWVNADGWFADGTDSNGNVIVKRVNTWSGISQYIKARAGEKYVLSANVRGDGTSTMRFYVTERDESYADIVGSVLGTNVVVPTVETRIHRNVYTVKNDCNLHFRIENSVYGATLWVSSLKLEKGDKATDWTPAPEDMASISRLESEIKMTSDKIAANISSIDSLGTRVSTVEQTADGLTVSLEETNTKLNDLEIGGRNLLLNTKNFVGVNIAGSATIASETYKDLKVKTYDNTADTSNSKDIIIFKQIYAENFGDQYTFSFYAKGSGLVRTYFYGATGYTPCVKTEQSDGTKSTPGDGSSPWTLTDTWTRYWVTWTLGNTGDISIEKYILFRLAGGAVSSICGAKLEKGNKATDWTPAPEDVQNGIDESAKTATNYLNFSNSGLVVGDMTTSTLGKNVLIDSDSVDIRNGESVLASFGAKEVTLGQNAADSVINLCDGAATIKALISESSNSYPAYDSMQLDSQRIVMTSKDMKIDTSASADSWTNSADIRLVSQSGSGSASSTLKSETTVVASGNNSTTGMFAQSSSKLETTYTQVYSNFKDVTNGVTTSNSMRMYPNNTIFDQPIIINGTYYRGKQNVLWSGAFYMTETHSITLSESALTQPTGLVLTFSRYADGAAQNNNYNHFFVPKEFISSNSGFGSEFTMMSNALAEVCHKYLYITDTTIRGHASNDATGTGASGITYINTRYVLRRVVGV